MPNRDQTWGFGGGRNSGRGRRDEERGGRGGHIDPRGEHRSFGGEPWEGEGRYGARYDQDRAGYRDHEFDPDYLAWRAEQMRNHDRAYEEWRHGRQQAYDEDYRRHRQERRQGFPRADRARGQDH